MKHPTASFANVKSGLVLFGLIISGVASNPLLAEEAVNVPAGCVLVEEYCTEGAGERMIDGYPLRRECWAKRKVYSCPDPGPQGVCAPLSNSADCERTGSQCVEEDEDGVCIKEENTYACAKEFSGTGFEFNGMVPGRPERDVDKPLQCGSNYFCPDGSCDQAAEPVASQGFGKAASWMGLLNQMGKEKDADGLTMFKGEALSCSRAILDIKDCCDDSGWLLDTLGCSTKEKILAEKKKQKLSVLVGTFCADEILGVCTREKDSYCTFNSKFSRIIQVQGRAQLGIGWGSPETPNCAPLSVDQVQALDFSKINLSELYNDMLNNAKVPTPTDTNSAVGQRIKDYYNQ